MQSEMQDQSHFIHFHIVHNTCWCLLVYKHVFAFHEAIIINKGIE